MKQQDEINPESAATDLTIQGPMSMSLGIAMVASDPEQHEAIIEHLAIIGSKASPSTQEFLARQMNILGVQ